MKVIFLDSALEDLANYKYSNPKLAFKVMDLILEIQKNPFTGKGKPEPLKGNLQGYWSRRITDEHRLVYKIYSDTIEIFSCHSHYFD